MTDYKERFAGESEQFEKAAKAFFGGEMSKQDYKGISGGFGSYAEKGGSSGMLRLRMTAGRVSKQKLSFLVNTMEKYEIPFAKLTTCETIQLHRLEGEIIPKIYEEALEAGIFCRGGGGDFPRNIMASPLSGVQVGEAFDILPYAQEAGDYLLGLIGKIKLPRKLKVAFSNGAGNETHATFRDLGFVANADGTFTVYSAGGLGSNPKMGLKVAEGVDPNQTLYYIKAMVDTFMAHGNYTVRSKARTRYMQDTLGKEGYVEAYTENVKAALAAGGLDIAPKAIPVTKQGEGQLEANRVVSQKQPGLFSVWYHPLGGKLEVASLRKIYDAIQDMEDVELRIAPDETLYIINCTAQEAQKVLDATAGGAENQFECSVACIGGTVCQQGVGDSQALYAACVEAVRQAGIAGGALPQVHISGCPSSCGAHQIGAIGFRGGMNPVDGVPKPIFTLHIGGSDTMGEEAFGEDLGAVLAQDIPEFLVQLGERVQQSGESYASWQANHMGELKELAAKYLL